MDRPWGTCLLRALHHTAHHLVCQPSPPTPIPLSNSNATGCPLLLRNPPVLCFYDNMCFWSSSGSWNLSVACFTVCFSLLWPLKFDGFQSPLLILHGDPMTPLLQRLNLP